MPAPARRAALYLIRIYQRDVAHRLDTACPFEPTCSRYAVQAYERYGFTRATTKVIGRLRRCQPGYEGSFVDAP